MSRPTWYPSPRWSSTRPSSCFVVRPTAPERIVPPMTRGPFVDATGESFTLSAAPSRIVSLVPSVTELLFALGAGDAVAGCTIFCTEPARGVAAKTRVGGEKNPKLGDPRVRDLSPHGGRGHPARARAGRGDRPPCGGRRDGGGPPRRAPRYAPTPERPR